MVKRRTFFQVLLGVCPFLRIAKDTTPKYANVRTGMFRPPSLQQSVQGRRIRVLVNGIDITTRCYEADEEDGVARCYKHNEKNQRFLETSYQYSKELGGWTVSRAVAEEELRGRVEIITG